VGQSETAVADMVDTFLYLTLARTGDQLQGIKKGILELADVIAVNKADEHHETEARRAARDLTGALRMLRSPDRHGWEPPVLTCSGLTNTGLDVVWQQILKHRHVLEAAGELAAKRRRQQVRWTWAMVRDRLLHQLREHPKVRELTPILEREVLDGTLTPALAADRILEAFQGTD
jgi:LAO/AO transport system kinase